MGEQGQPQTSSQPPSQDIAAQPRKRSKASWAVRIVLLVAPWLSQPILLLQELVAGRGAYGFLGPLSYALVGALLGALIAFIVVARPHHKPTVVLGCDTLALAAACGANPTAPGLSLCIPLLPSSQVVFVKISNADHIAYSKQWEPQ